MPIDPSIALGFRPTPNLAPDLGNSLANAQRLMQLQVQANEVKSQNALKDIMGQPGAIDANGNPTQAAMQQVMGVDPNYGMKLRQNALVSQEHQMQLQNNQTKRQEALQELVDPSRAAAMKAYTDTEGSEEVKRAAGQKALDEGLDELSKGGGLSEQEKQTMNRSFDPARISMMSDRWQSYQKNQTTMKRQELLDKSGEFGNPVEVKYTDDQGNEKTTLAQQSGYNGGWVTADEKREKIPYAVTPFKPPAVGSVAEQRSAIAQDVAADPDFKDKSPGQRAMEIETRLKIAQGQLASPEAQKDIAKAIASYELAPMSGYSMTKSGSSGASIMSEVLKLNPNYQAGRFGEVNKAMVAFGSGKQGDTVRSVNVAVQHLDVLEKAARALDNHDWALLNKIGNDIAAWTGEAAPTTFDGLRRVVGTEVEKAVAGGIGAVQDREDFMKALSRDNSSDQLFGPDGTIPGFKKLMAGQVQGLKRQYEDSTGFNDSSPFAFNKKLLPETAKALGLLETKDGGKGGGDQASEAGNPGYNGQQAPEKFPDAKRAPDGYWYTQKGDQFYRVEKPTDAKAATPAPVTQAAKVAPAPPKSGEVVNGYRYNGGDPADPKSWTKV